MTSAAGRVGRSRILLARSVLGVTLSLSLSVSPPAVGAPAGTTAVVPEPISSATAVPGPGVGQVTVSWVHSGRDTTFYHLETGLTSFDPASTTRRHGRNTRHVNVAPSRRSVTLTARQLASAGAPLASANHLFLRLTAVNRSALGSASRPYPTMLTVVPRAQAPKASGTALRVGAFNVRTAKATTDLRVWTVRAPEVAAEILARRPGIVAVQELSPGRADGQKSSAPGLKIRQTESLEAELAQLGGGRYQLHRTTSYVSPSTSHGSQGTRLLYDSDRFTLLSDCPEKTGSRSYNTSCSVRLPILSGDSEGVRRRAAIALLSDRATKQRFWAVSVHFDERHSSNPATEARYDALRRDQARAVLAALTEANPKGYPSVIAGDLNAWQVGGVGNGPHDTFVRAGYYDGAAAVRTVNRQYGTVNHFRLTLQPNSSGYGSRLDVALVKGAPGSAYYENVMLPTDPTRPSDHNLVVADFVL